MSDKPTNVIGALLAVMGDLPAIGKDSKAAKEQGGYAYRGIEAITAHTQELFAKYGVVFVPRVVSYEIREITVNQKPWTDTVEQVEYDVYGPGGIEDRITVGPILAIGRDNSDKGGNKCLTQAYKYALLQTLCISDAKDDGDKASTEADNRQPPQTIDPEAVALRGQINSAIAAGKVPPEDAQREADKLGIGTAQALSSAPADVLRKMVAALHLDDAREPAGAPA